MGFIGKLLSTQFTPTQTNLGRLAQNLGDVRLILLYFDVCGIWYKVIVNLISYRILTPSKLSSPTFYAVLISARWRKVDEFTIPPMLSEAIGHNNWIVGLVWRARRCRLLFGQLILCTIILLSHIPVSRGGHFALLFLCVL